jgi:hypothetical protein
MRLYGEYCSSGAFTPSPRRANLATMQILTSDDNRNQHHLLSNLVVCNRHERSAARFVGFAVPGVDAGPGDVLDLPVPAERSEITSKAGDEFTDTK